jgi:exopolyphosphatase/guanosine-5'-triphosphate,3'-diphosphate pyrophosphatase
MRIGIIDLGTNSVRFAVHQLGPGRRVRQLHREKIMVRLGQGAFLQGKLDRSAIQRTLAAFVRFKKIAGQYRTSKIIAFGTSTLREVSDRESFVEALKEKSGIELRVIPGSEEAQLIALGILSHEKIGKERIALVDIGGGSTEINICQGRKILHGHSFRLGTARLQQVFLKRSPPGQLSVDELRKAIRVELSEVMNAERWPKVNQVIGSSGTIRALAKLLTGSDSRTFPKEKLRGLINRISGMNTTELLGLSGIRARIRFWRSTFPT